VAVGEHDAVVLQDVEQIGQLLHVGGDVGIVAAQMHVVELQMDDVPDAVAERATGGGIGGRDGERRRGAERAEKQVRM
jgi:hypothetical protein